MECDEIVNSNCSKCKKAVDCYSWLLYNYTFEKELREEYMLRYVEEDYAEGYLDQSNL